jgi:Mrp family chromosome partitioning ATPase
MSKETDPRFNPFKVKMNKQSEIRKVVAVVSGKGGVGKSTVTGLLAVNTSEKGYFTGILDADITGPSIGKMFGITDRAYGTEDGLIYPALTSREIKIITSNMLLDEEDKAVMWRGLLINGAVKDFYSKVLWGDLDVLYIDMPPGTGDVPLTIYQSLPIDGIVLVTTPQDLVSMIVAKAIDMANQMSVPILGIIENMSYMECPCCNQRIYPFGEGRVEEFAQKHGVSVLAKLPIVANLTEAADQGEFDALEYSGLAKAVDSIFRQLQIEDSDELV